MNLKILIISFCIICASPSWALNFKKPSALSLEYFSSLHPSKSFSAIMLDDYKFGELNLEASSILRGKVIEVVAPKHGKQNAYFVFKPYTYTVPSKNETKNIQNTDIEAKVSSYQEFNKMKAAKAVGLGVAGFFFKGAAQAFYFGKGALKASKNESKLKSGAKEVYENSPLVYIREGEELKIYKNDIISLRFYHYETPKWKIWKRY